MGSGGRHSGTWAALAENSRAVLSWRWLPVGVALLAILLTLPSLNVDWVVDDYFHRAVMVGSRTFGQFADSPLDTFRFFDGDPERTRRLIDIGFIPWWTNPQIKAAFWRPLTVLTHWVDYRLWPETPALMHAHNLLWFGALVAAVAWLYRRLMPMAWIAGLAGLLYAIDDAHGMAVGFLANRNVLLSATFGVLALIAHDRWRRAGWRGGVVIAPLLLALSLMSKEAGVATCGYLAAYALFLDGGQWRDRLLSLVPYGIVVLAWRGIWASLGYGVANSGLYIDPVTEPLRFAAAVVDRVPRYLLGQWAFPPTESYLFGPEIAFWQWWVAVAFLALLVVMLWPMLRHDRLARFWALGMLLAVLPICAAFPADRLLFFVGIGATGLLAQFLAGVSGDVQWRPQARAWRVPAKALGVLFVILHVVVAPAGLAIRSGFPAGGSGIQSFLFRAPLDESVVEQDLVLLNPPSVLHIAYMLVERELDDEPVPRRVRQLASGVQPLLVTRPDAHTLVVRPEGGYIAWVFERLFRDERYPMRAGERIELTGMTIVVTEVTPDGRPQKASFRFDVPLEDPSLRWFYWKDGDFIPFSLPEVGEVIELGPASRPVF